MHIKIKKGTKPLQVGCKDESHFSRYLEKTPLLVINQYTHMYTVMDYAGERFNIKKDLAVVVTPSKIKQKFPYEKPCNDNA